MIIDTWLALFGGDTPEGRSAALADLNKSLGSNQKNSAISQWKAESKGLSSQVYNYMLRLVLVSEGKLDMMPLLRSPDAKNPVLSHLETKNRNDLSQAIS